MPTHVTLGNITQESSVQFYLCLSHPVNTHLLRLHGLNLSNTLFFIQMKCCNLHLWPLILNAPGEWSGVKPLMFYYWNCEAHDICHKLVWLPIAKILHTLVIFSHLGSFSKPVHNSLYAAVAAYTCDEPWGAPLVWIQVWRLFVVFYHTER